MLREVVFEIGGGLTIAMSLLLLLGLLWAAAGWLFFDAYLGVGIGVGLGAFFVYVGRGERAERLAMLREAERSVPGGGGAPPSR